jgi:hypothetical protein
MRGSACSGGAFDYFERLQWFDGYDLVEALAAQDWSDGVALIGKSYPGIITGQSETRDTGLHPTHLSARDGDDARHRCRATPRETNTMHGVRRWSSRTPTGEQPP